MNAPFKLAPLQDIINVGWNVGRIAVLEFHYEKNFAHPTITLDSLPFGTSFNLFDAVIYNSAGPVNPPIADPITILMRKYLRLWNRPPHKISNLDNRFAGSALLFFNLPKIREYINREKPQTPIDPFSFKIRTPATGASQFTTEQLYYIWDTNAGSFEAALAHPGIWIDSIWGTLAEATTRFDNLIGPYAIEPVSEDTEIPDFFGWDFRVSTYQKKLNFPVAPGTANPAWDVLTTSKEKTNIISDSGSPHSANTITITINTKTLKITTAIT